MIQRWLEQFNHAQLIVEMLYNDCWVYILNDQIVGFLLVSDTGEILMHYVAARFQRLGFGTQLFDQMHKSLVRKNIHKIKVQSTQTALSYYQKNGFFSPNHQSENEENYHLYKYAF